MQPLLPDPLTETSSKHARGRPFAVGNPGHKVGSKNRTTVLAAALLAGEAQPLVRKAVEIAQRTKPRFSGFATKISAA